MAFMVLVAFNVAAAEFYDPNDSNNQANASISASDDHPAVTPGDNGNVGIITENGISGPASTTQNPEVEPAAKTTNKTMGMQPTGVPLFGFVMAVLMVLSGLAISKRK